MNYEPFRDEYVALAARLKTQLDAQQKLFKRISKSIDAGDIRNAVKDLESFKTAQLTAFQIAEDTAQTIGGFNVADYLGSGNFAAQLVAECQEHDIDIVGEDSTWEIFPYRVKINPSDEEVLVNGKKATGVRPAALAQTLAGGKAKLLSANFNADKFAVELAAAYDLSIVSGAKGKGKTVVLDADVYLNTLYKFLTPMARSRRDYDARAFAFDLARLYSASDVILPDGRKLQFGPSRNNNRAIRILDTYNNELFIATVRFYHD